MESNGKTEGSKSNHLLNRRADVPTPIITHTEIVDDDSGMEPLAAKKSSKARSFSSLISSLNCFKETPAELEKAPPSAVLRKSAPSPVPPPPPPKTAAKAAPLSQSSEPSSATKLRKSDPSESTNKGGPSVEVSEEMRGRQAGDSSLLPLDTRGATGLAPPSTYTNPRPRQLTPDTSAIRKRASWLPGIGPKSRTRSSSPDIASTQGVAAWINGIDGKKEYKLNHLHFDKVPELWDNEQGNVLIYLFPRDSGRDATFKIRSSVLASSPLLKALVQDDLDTGGEFGAAFQGLSFHGAERNETPSSTRTNDASMDKESTRSSLRTEKSSEDLELHLPVGQLSQNAASMPESSDTELLIDVRNFFAFFAGVDLVLTPAQPTVFQALVAVSKLLRKYEYSNSDESTFGEAATESFNKWMKKMGYADFQGSQDNIARGLILGECMKSEELYCEAFAHAIGKFTDMKDVDTRLAILISSNTKNRMEKAHINLQRRHMLVSERLQTFDFPSLFAGIASSTSNEEYISVNFRAWKAGYMAMRKEVLSYYKSAFGHWPPKASSKKNDFTEGGLNRLVLRNLYSDMCDLYDLLVDRKSFTPRALEKTPDQELQDLAKDDPPIAALRILMGEFDKSSPPVIPPIPFDVPLLPAMLTVDPFFDPKTQKEHKKAFSRKLKKEERALILEKSHNEHKDLKPFPQHYASFEATQAKSMSCQEMYDERIGHWIFIYAVIQSLPLLSIDAPGVNHSTGVEYFLCEPVMDSLPWMDTKADVKVYSTINSEQVAVLPSHLVLHSSDAIYRKSHCWTAAAEWINLQSDTESRHQPTPTPNNTGIFSPLEAPPSISDIYAGPSTLGTPPSRGVTRTSDTMTELNPKPRKITQDEKRRSIAFPLNALPMSPQQVRQMASSPRSMTPNSAGPGSRPSSRDAWTSRESHYRSSSNDTHMRSVSETSHFRSMSRDGSGYSGSGHQRAPSYNMSSPTVLSDRVSFNVASPSSMSSGDTHSASTSNLTPPASADGEARRDSTTPKPALTFDDILGPKKAKKTK